MLFGSVRVMPPESVREHRVVGANYEVDYAYIVQINSEFSPESTIIHSKVRYISARIHCCPVKPGSPARNGMILNGVLSI